MSVLFCVRMLCMFVLCCVVSCYRDRGTIVHVDAGLASHLTPRTRKMKNPRVMLYTTVG